MKRLLILIPLILVGCSQPDESTYLDHAIKEASNVYNTDTLLSNEMNNLPFNLNSDSEINMTTKISNLASSNLSAIKNLPVPSSLHDLHQRLIKATEDGYKATDNAKKYVLSSDSNQYMTARNQLESSIKDIAVIQQELIDYRAKIASHSVTN